MANKVHAVVNGFNERAKFYGQPDRLTTQDIFAVLEFYNRKSCKSQLPTTHIDHVIPLSQGGQNNRANLQLLTESENKQKGDQTADYRNNNICPDDFIPQESSDYNYNNDANAQGVKTPVDWDAVRLEYVAGQMSTRTLAKAHEIPYRTLADRCINENWITQRTNYRSEIVAQTLQALKDSYVDAKTTAIEVGQQVLVSWLKLGQPSNASDALNAAKLLLLAEGEATDRVEVYRDKVLKALHDNQLDESEPSESFESAFNRLQAVAGTDADTLNA